MVGSTGKTISTSIKYRTLRIDNDVLYIKEEPVLRYKYGLLFFNSRNHYSIQKILTDLQVQDYVMKTVFLSDTAINNLVENYINNFVYRANRFSYINYDIAIKIHNMSDVLFRDYNPRIRYYRKIGPLEYERARQRAFSRQCNKEKDRVRYTLNGIWKERRWTF